MRGPGAIRRGLQPTYVELEQLRRAFGCDVHSTPPGMVVVAWDPQASAWWAAPHQDSIRSARLATLLAFVSQLGGRLHAERWWALVCLNDGWPEGVPLGTRPPSLSATRPTVLAFGRHRGDASVTLLPDTHYLYSVGYLKMRARLAVEDRRWSSKQASAIYCGGRHGSPFGFEVPPDSTDCLPRELLARRAAGTDLPLEVHLGGGVSRRDQLRHRVLLDVDGHARTWDAWAWKTRSRSVVLSQTSVWDSFFSVEFRAWEHFVPLANDFGDLEERLAWCLSNEREARAIAQRGSSRAREAYALSTVRQRARVAIESAVLAPSVK